MTNDLREKEVAGVTPAGPGCEPTASAADASSQSRIPNAADSDFECAICQRMVCTRWSHRGRDQILPPLCLYCEHHYSHRLRGAHSGSFRDRREVRQGFALAEALHCEAASKKWSSTYAAS